MLGKKEKHRTERIELTENGFQIIEKNKIHQVQWADIEKLIGFKSDNFTTDNICLKIEAADQTLIATEEFEGWRIFMGGLLNEFPDIDKNWEGIISQPPFKRNETVLYNKKTLGNNI